VKNVLAFQKKRSALEPLEIWIYSLTCAYHLNNFGNLKMIYCLPLKVSLDETR
jgi:hypothetical protein